MPSYKYDPFGCRRTDCEAYPVGIGSGILRFDTNRLPSNLPCEDEIIAASGAEVEEYVFSVWLLLR